jgi:hypothetical protein
VKTFILREAWGTIRKAVSAIEAGDYPKALTIYGQMFCQLKRDFAK